MVLLHINYYIVEYLSKPKIIIIIIFERKNPKINSYNHTNSLNSILIFIVVLFTVAPHKIYGLAH